jgi:vancomycin aglycone glucosyltransferase
MNPGFHVVLAAQLAVRPERTQKTVAGLGIGVAYDVHAPTAESLAAALRTAVAPETRTRAEAVAGTVRADGATVAAELLLDAAGSS